MKISSSLVTGDHDEHLARLRAAKTPVVSLIAPPGYGKRALAHAYAASFQGTAAMPADQLDRGAVDAWAGSSEPACLLIEDAHRVSDADLNALMKELVQKRPRENAIIITSVREFGFSLSEVIEPHLTTALRVPDLRISLERLRLLGNSYHAIDDASLYRIYLHSAGWPAIVYYLLAAAARGQFDRELSQLHYDAWADVFDWIGTFLEETLEADMWAALVESAARLDARYDDFGPPGLQNPANRLVRQFQLADIGIAGEVRVAPFLRLYMHVRRRRELTAAALRVLEKDGTRDPVRASRALINVGELRRAEELMSQMDLIACLTVGDYAYPGVLLERLSTITPPYQLYPRVWLALNAPRGCAVGALAIAEEGVTVLSNGSHPPQINAWIRFLTAIAFVRAGQLNVALGFIEELELEECPEAESLASMACAAIDVVTGQYQRAIDRWNQNCNALLCTPTVYALCLRHVARATLATGALTRAREYLRLMSSITSLGTSPFVYAIAEMEAAVGAWLLGNDEEFVRRRREVLNLLLHYEAPMYWRLVAAMHDLAIAGEVDGDRYYETITDLMLACQPRDDADFFANAAIRDADESQSVWLRCCARIVSAIRQPSSAGCRMSEAVDIAQRSDAPLLIHLVEQFTKTQSELSHLSALINRARGGMKPAELIAGRYETDVIAGRVNLSGRPLRLSDGVLQLVMCLAVNRNGIPRERLIDLLWPEQDGLSALAALKMCVHRARMQLGKQDSIVVSRGTYTLSPSIETNYHALLELASRTLPVPLPDDIRAVCDRTISGIWESGEAAWSTRWTWFAPYQRAIGDAGQSIGTTLVRDAISRAEHDRALLVARGMAAMRPFDERPRILIVQTYVAMDQHGEARREYNDFQELVRKELGEEPSGRFQARCRELLAV